MAREGRLGLFEGDEILDEIGEFLARAFGGATAPARSSIILTR